MYRLKYLLAGLMIGLMFSSTAFAQPVKEFMLKLVDYPVLVRGIEYVDQKFPFLSYNGTTYVPLRAISEMLNVEIQWNEALRRVEIGNFDPKLQHQTRPVEPDERNDTGNTFAFHRITLGDTETEVYQTLGMPARKDLSKYGFYWQIYNQDYSNYLQVGIENGRVVGLYSNSHWDYLPYNLTASSTRGQVQEALGQPLEHISKGNVRFIIKGETSATYLLDDYYVTFFYDLLDGQRIDSILLVEKKTEEAMEKFYATCSIELRTAFEKQVFDLTNVFRLKNGLEPLYWNESAALVARGHSNDMAFRNYFSHTGMDGRSPFARMRDGGIEYRRAAENIASGQTNGIEAYHGWLNSAGHRDGLLGNFELLGVGVHCNGEGKPYYTQIFYTGPGEKQSRP